MTPLDCLWPGMLSCHHLCTLTGFPSYSWINLSRSILLFSLDPPSNCPKSWVASSFPMMVLWPGVALSSSSNKGMSSLASTCNLTGWAQPWWKEGRRLSCPRIRNRFMLSALILQPTLIVDRPIKEAAFGNILASSQSLIWAGQKSSQGIPSSLPCLRTEAPSFIVWECFAAGVNP